MPETLLNCPKTEEQSDVLTVVALAWEPRLRFTQRKSTPGAPAPLLPAARRVPGGPHAAGVVGRRGPRSRPAGWYRRRPPANRHPTDGGNYPDRCGGGPERSRNGDRPEHRLRHGERPSTRRRLETVDPGQHERGAGQDRTFGGGSD